ncbi:MAG: RHS repeat-associated core domain-containing protein [Rhodanobacteraceae bacterium]
MAAAKFEVADSSTCHTKRNGNGQLRPDNLRSYVHVGGSTSTYNYDGSNRLTSIVNSANGTTTLIWDAQGNLASKNGQTYTFDYGNRLRSDSVNAETFRYDAWGRRQRADSASLGEILWMYGKDGKPVFMANRQIGGTQYTYLYLGDHLVATQMNVGSTHPVYWHTTDALGSEVAHTNADAWADHFNYYQPWGGLQSGSLDDGPGYAGQINDTNTGLSYADQRYYDPRIPRFISMDPVGVDATTGANFNRYWYANDNPYRYIDPTGTTCKSVGKGSYDCTVDENSGKFTKAQIAEVNKAYTNAVNHLMAHPDVKVAITVRGHTVEASAGAVGKALIGAIVKTKINASGNTDRASTLGGGLTPKFGEHGHPVTTIDSYALSHNPTTGVDHDLSATFIHEGIHELPGDKAMLPLYKSDPTFGKDHVLPYDAASNYLFDPKD